MMAVLTSLAIRGPFNRMLFFHFLFFFFRKIAAIYLNFSYGRKGSLANEAVLTSWWMSLMAKHKSTLSYSSIKLFISNSLYFLWLLAWPGACSQMFSQPLTLRSRTIIWYNCFLEKSWVREGTRSLDTSNRGLTCMWQGTSLGCQERS